MMFNQHRNESFRKQRREEEKKKNGDDDFFIISSTKLNKRPVLNDETFSPNRNDVITTTQRAKCNCSSRAMHRATSVDELSDVASIPSITLTNDDFMRQSPRPAPSTTKQVTSSSTSTMTVNPRAIKRSDTLTTLNTESSFRTVGHHDHENETRVANELRKPSPILKKRLSSVNDLICSNQPTRNQTITNGGLKLRQQQQMNDFK